MTDLTPLIDRVRSGEGPDRELDADIFDAFADLAVPAVHGRSWPFVARSELDRIIPRLTSSLDAVVALVGEKLPGWTEIVDTRKVPASDGPIRVRLYAPGKISANFYPPVVAGSHAEAYGSDLCRTWLAATLSALQAQGEKP